MKKTILILSTIIFFIACNDYRKQINIEVKKLEQEVSNKFDTQKAATLIITYNKFIEKFPEDTICKTYMIKATEISILSNDATNAIKFINMFLLKYPNDVNAPLMQFKKAIVYDLLVLDPIKAVSEYTLFIQKYPTHAMKKDAENAVLLINDPDAFTKMITRKDSVVADSVPIN